MNRLKIFFTAEARRHKAKFLACLCACVAIILSACSPPTPTPELLEASPTKFALAVPSATSTPTNTPTATRTPTATSTATPTLTRTRTPLPTAKPTNTVAPATPTLSKPTATPVLSDEKYDAVSIISSSAPHSAAEVNITARGFVSTTATLDLVDIDGPTDPAAPRLYTLFADRRIPGFSAVYQLYRWDEMCNCRGTLIDNPPVSVASLVVNPGETLRLPESGYNLGEGFNAIVLYADASRITFAYTREDNPVRGYVVYIDGVAVATNLLALYQQLNSAGRGELPGLRIGQLFARTTSTELKLAIRDAGGFMDPRSRKDWWKK